MERTKLVCTTVISIVSMLILGEMFGRVISNPILACKNGRRSYGVGNYSSYAKRSSTNE